MRPSNKPYTQCTKLYVLVCTFWIKSEQLTNQPRDRDGIIITSRRVLRHNNNTTLDTHLQCNTAVYIYGYNAEAAAVSKSCTIHHIKRIPARRD